MPGGIWDSNRYEIRALIRKDGKAYREVPLVYDGSVSDFAGTVGISEPGAYEVAVYAYDPSNSNSGLGMTSFTASE